MNDYSKFLKDVEAMNEKYASIYLNCELESLVMPFWSWEKIQAGLKLRDDWEVDDSLIPFYGDWHDLFCLHQDSGEIVALNDDRQVICKWDSISDFTSCLSEQEIVYDDALDYVTAAFPADFPEPGNGSKLKH